MNLQSESVALAMSALSRLLSNQIRATVHERFDFRVGELGPPVHWMYGIDGVRRDTEGGGPGRRRNIGHRRRRMVSTRLLALGPSVLLQKMDGGDSSLVLRQRVLGSGQRFHHSLLSGYYVGFGDRCTTRRSMCARNDSGLPLRINFVKFRTNFDRIFSVCGKPQEM